MSCFWQAIYKRLNATELASLRIMHQTPIMLIRSLQRANIRTRGIKHNGKLVTEKQAEEHFMWIKDYKDSGNDGHETSSCDPFLCLLVYKFKWFVRLNYDGNMNTIEPGVPWSRVINLNASRSHIS